MNTVALLNNEATSDRDTKDCETFKELYAFFDEERNYDNDIRLGENIPTFCGSGTMLVMTYAQT